MSVLVEIRNLCKRFGPITAVDDVSFSAGRGEVLGFLGPNGAGKTTTMRMITGFLPPDAGTAVVCGHDVSTEPVQIKRRIGYLPEGAPLYGEMTPASFLSFVADVRGLNGPARRARLSEVIETLHLGAVWMQPIATLSKGFKRRVGLAQAILLDPDVLILDEPTDGLDPNQKHDVRELLREMSGDKAIVISTHILEEVEAVCSRAVIIASGRLVADAAPDVLLARSHYHNAVVVRVAASSAELGTAVLGRLDGVANVELSGAPDGTVRLVAVPKPGYMLLDQVRGAMQGAGLVIDEIALERGRLDDVFRDLTGKAA